MQYSKTISLECPHCDTKCQFVQVDSSHRFCKSDELHHIAFICTNCQGIIATKWNASVDNVSDFQSRPTSYGQCLNSYYPLVGDWKPRVNLSLITNNEVKDDFKEATGCYNNGFYNACMMMARRAIQQEMLINKAKGDNLYQQIELTGISKKLKALLHKIKNFGNHGAHPDFCLYDENGNQIEDKKEFAKLSLEFLDRYFADEYEIDSLVENAPKSEKELDS
ncbi:DUF4145 domain-containing protein [Patescibacteria group bacterium]|nr:DUF4145 domain-containing protein [Patescibacteria group bacterium]MBU4142291.1 DUF4145 domain-containing protein [Patescibacteria group bacterium]MBU4339089.1 DUF4145 domain-containing protein [Patescibacteria group bacterium]MCG2694779.1 DUF4145 domain-containing protein [Candidatus Parcubacteria bacterium]